MSEEVTKAVKCLCMSSQCVLYLVKILVFQRFLNVGDQSWYSERYKRAHRIRLFLQQLFSKVLPTNLSFSIPTLSSTPLHHDVQGLRHECSGTVPSCGWSVLPIECNMHDAKIVDYIEQLVRSVRATTLSSLAILATQSVPLSKFLGPPFTLAHS